MTNRRLTAKISETLSKQTEVEITSRLDTGRLSRAVFYFNFANYSILAGCVYVICLILSSFRDEKIRKRTVISCMEYKKYNRLLLLSNSLFAVLLWLFYVLLSFVLVGDVMFTAQGLVLVINSFVFTLCALAIAFLIGNLVKSKNAVNGIVNVVALGSSFLCGAFGSGRVAPGIGFDRRAYPSVLLVYTDQRAYENHGNAEPGNTEADRFQYGHDFGVCFGFYHHSQYRIPRQAKDRLNG